MYIYAYKYVQRDFNFLIILTCLREIFLTDAYM